MNVCIVHADRRAREVLARALRRSLGVEVKMFSCCENVLASSMDYAVFIVYNNFGRRRMSGIKGVSKIRIQKPDAYLIGVSSKPYSERRFLPAGADAFLLRAGNEVEELIDIVRSKRQYHGR